MNYSIERGKDGEAVRLWWTKERLCDCGRKATHLRADTDAHECGECYSERMALKYKGECPWVTG